jgi:selT/selW/selH-like putative selenoprotein
VAEAKMRFGVESELVEGHGGAYKVWIDDELIWDKKSMGGFPQEEEILEKIATWGGRT